MPNQQNVLHSIELLHLKAPSIFEGYAAKKTIELRAEIERLTRLLSDEAVHSGDKSFHAIDRNLATEQLDLIIHLSHNG